MTMTRGDHHFRIFYRIDHSEAGRREKYLHFLKTFESISTFCSTRPSGGAFGTSI